MLHMFLQSRTRGRSTPLFSKATRKKERVHGRAHALTSVQGLGFTRV